MDFEDGGKLGIDLAALYMRLRDELGHDHSGMNPNDRTRAPIAMAILAYAGGGIANIQDIEVSVREVLGLPDQTIFQIPLGFLSPAIVLNTAAV